MDENKTGGRRKVVVPLEPLYPEKSAQGVAAAKVDAAAGVAETAASEPAAAAEANAGATQEGGSPRRRVVEPLEPLGSPSVVKAEASEPAAATPAPEATAQATAPEAEASAVSAEAEAEKEAYEEELRARADETYRKIPKGLLWRCWFIFCFFQRTCQCFDRGYCNALTYGIMPILRYLYEGQEDAEEQIREGLLRTRDYYLCEVSFSTIVFSIIIGMEEQKANGAPVTGELISATKASIMGPLSGLGDAIHGSTFRQIAIALTIPYCLEGNVLAAVLMLVGMNITPWLTTLIGYPQGYKLGNEFVLKLLANGVMQKVADAAGIMSMFIMGGMTSKYVSITTSLVFANEYKEIVIQDMIDSAIPGILTIGTVFIFLGLIQKKVSTNTITIGTIVVGILLSVFGIMG